MWTTLSSPTVITSVMPEVMHFRHYSVFSFWIFSPLCSWRLRLKHSLQCLKFLDLVNKKELGIVIGVVYSQSPRTQCWWRDFPPDPLGRRGTFPMSQIPVRSAATCRAWFGWTWWEKPSWECLWALSGLYICQTTLLMWDEEDRDLQVKLLFSPSLVGFLPALTGQWNKLEICGFCSVATLVLLRLFAVSICFYSC